MNKLVLVEDLKINKGDYLIEEIKNKNIDINDKVNLYCAKTGELNLNLLNNSNLYFEKISYLNNNEDLTINLFANATLDLRYLIINTGENKVNLNIKMVDNDSRAHVLVRVINTNNSSKAILNVNGYILKDTLNNELIEDLKGLIIDTDTIEIKPNIYAETNEVVANHLVTIGSFNPSSLFYLKSKQISEEEAKKLLMLSFLKSNFSYFKDLIKTEVINFE